MTVTPHPGTPGRTSRQAFAVARALLDLAGSGQAHRIVAIDGHVALEPGTELLLVTTRLRAGG